MCRSMVDIQSPTAEISRGKKRKKKQDENIYGLPITQGDHKNIELQNRQQENIRPTAIYIYTHTRREISKLAH